MTDTRHPNLQRFLDGMAAKIGPAAKMLMEGSDHPYHCKCAICLEWWATVGPEHDNSWGPFSAKEIKEYKAHVHN